MKYIFFLFFFLHLQSVYSQTMEMKPLSELINTEDPGWEIVKSWISKATNEVEVLEKDPQQADTALYRTQVTSRSPLGAIVYETGGILVNKGWIRILGSGSEKLNRNLPEWNKGKSFESFGQAMPFVLIADDALGGFFALNGGTFGSQDLGKVFYLSPDNLEWEALGIGYSDFLYWTFTGDLDKFYEGLRWKDWEAEVPAMGPDRGMNFYPPLWVKHEGIDSLSRKDVPMEEIWHLHMGMIEELIKKSKN